MPCAHRQHSFEQLQACLLASSGWPQQGACLCLGHLWGSRPLQAWLWVTLAAHRMRSAEWQLPGSRPAAQAAWSPRMLPTLTCSQQAAPAALRSPEELCSTELSSTRGRDQCQATVRSKGLRKAVCGGQSLALRGEVR